MLSNKLIIWVTSNSQITGPEINKIIFPSKKGIPFDTDTPKYYFLRGIEQFIYFELVKLNILEKKYYDAWKKFSINYTDFMLYKWEFPKNITYEKNEYIKSMKKYAKTQKWLK